MNNNMKMPYPAWEVEINNYFMPWMRDHKIDSMTVIPGAAYVEAGLALHEKEFGNSACTLQDLEFNQVLVVDEKRIQMFHTTYNPQNKRYSVYSRFREDNSPWTLHASGRMLKDTLSRNIPSIPLTDIRKRCTNEANATEFYTKLSGRGLNYGPWFQGVKQILKGKNEVLVKIEGDASLIRNQDNYLLHPTILDSGFQTMVAIVGDSSNNPNPFVPVSIDQVMFYTSPLNECWSYCRITEVTDNTIKGDLILFDDNGEVMVALEGITCQAINSSKGEDTDKMDNWFYQYTWSKAEPIKANDNSNAGGKYIVFGDYDNIELLQELSEKGVDFTLVTKGESYVNDDGLLSVNPASEEDFHKLFANDSYAHILYTWSMETSGKGAEILYTDAVDQTMPVVYIAKALAKNRASDKVRMVIVTRGAQVALEGDKGTALDTSAFWGLNHLIGNENPNVTPKTIDLNATPTDGEFVLLVNEIISGNKDEDVAIRENVRLSRSLQALSMVGNTSGEKKKTTTETPVSLETGQIGRLDSLYYEEFERKAELAPDEIEIRNYAACLNLKDGLKVIGQLSEKATKGSYYERNIGHEAAGVITRVGSNVKDFKVGEEIILAAPEGCLRSYVVSVPTYYLRKPANIKFEDALMVVPYMTVLYSLRNRAQLQKGEKILIHNGTGGVGLAAIQYAQHVGAEIYTTAGSEEKREYLRNLGIKHIYDSRSLDYVKQILDDTNGYGVDVVLNAIAGESLYQSFELLASYGRFVEIGKRDISENNGLPMQQFNNNVTFHGIDVDRLMMERPHVVQQIHRDIEKFYADGVFTAVNTHLFDAKDAVDAFNFMLQSKHIGKVVINFKDQEVEVPVKAHKKQIDTNATYLITGGTGGFGLQIAQWLSAKGVKQLVLASRSGAKSDEAKEAIQRMEAAGTKVYADPIDITNEEAVAKAVSKIKAEMPPLKGIIHGAVVLDDGFIVDMNRDRFITSYQAKVGGVLNVHKFTKEIPLDFFVSFSSISALIGNAGQANYVSSNTFLDQFAHYRRANGMQATTINLGVLGEVGVAARDANVTAILESGGIFGFSTQEALEGLGVVIENTPVQVGMFDVEWGRWSSINQKSAQSSRFKQLAESRGSAGAGASKVNEFAAELSAVAEGERTAYLENAVAEELARVLKLSVEKIDKSRGINFLGVDSLIAVELGRAISARFGVDVSTMELLSGPNFTQLGVIVMDKIVQSGAMVSDLESLSEEELDALLAEVKE
jgi:NADPH:quinone reductase-like Zn-dependent oxidoreductase/acyl carrier protein